MKVLVGSVGAAVKAGVAGVAVKDVWDISYWSWYGVPLLNLARTAQRASSLSDDDPALKYRREEEEYYHGGFDTCCLEDENHLHGVLVECSVRTGMHQL